MGEITVREERGIDRVQSDVGDVDVAFRGMRGDVTVRSDVGDVAVRVPGSLSASLDLATALGEVRTPGLQVSFSNSGRKRLAGTIGGGGDTLRVRTDVGDVTLRGL